MNFSNITKDSIPSDLIQPRRGQIYVGFKCHQKCGFCYYKSKCDDEMFDFDYVKKQIDFEYEYGIRDFEITGGEPSEYAFLPEVCDYIRNKDPNSKIAIITNGGLWDKPVWDKIDEVLVSYHLSKTPAVNNKYMFPLGTTYYKVLRTIDSAYLNNVLLRTNTVLGSFNLYDIKNIVSDLISFKPRIINFLPVNIFDEAKGMSSYIDYTNLRSVIKTQIDRIKNELPDTLVFIRYMPFCDMEGYEQHIVGHLQHIYDWFDWNRELDGIGVLDMLDKNPRDILGRYGSKSVDVCFEQRTGLYEKNINCMMCKYNIICDGVERTGGELFNQIVPSRGKIITNPMEFIGDTTYRLYNDIYGKR